MQEIQERTATRHKLGLPRKWFGALAASPKVGLLTCLFLAAITVGSYYPLFQNGFVKFDDYLYVVQNPHVLSGLNWTNICWAFQTGYASNWHPLTWLSHMLDVQLFGLRPGLH